MREIKDTLGIKYNKYTDIYKADNEQLGLLLKYIMWEFGKEVILKDVSELTKKRIEKKSKEIEEQIEELLEDDNFENVFNSLTQQVKRSHRSWELLKENLEKNKKKKNNDKDDDEDNDENKETSTTAKTKKKETPISTTTETEEKETETTINTDVCFSYDENNILNINSELLSKKIKSSKYDEDEVVTYVTENKKNLFLPNGCMVFSIEEIIKQMEEEGIKSYSEMMSELPFPVDV